MSKPIVAGNRPKQVVLTKGQTYYFCTCGRSAAQPYCDGSHAGTPFTPHEFEAETDGEAYLCACKQTGSPPFCDGSHKSIGDDRVGDT